MKKSSAKDELENQKTPKGNKMGGDKRQSRSSAKNDNDKSNKKRMSSKSGAKSMNKKSKVSKDIKKSQMKKK